MSNDVWALAEINNGRLAGISLQLASKAAELAVALGGGSAAVVMGTNTDGAAGEIGGCGVGKIYVAEGSVYDEYLIQPQVETLAALIREHQPRLVLFGCTNFGRDVAARVAARLGIGLEYNVSDVAIQSGDIVMTVPAFGGPEGFEQIEALASALNASVGASRAAVDAGWIPYAHQVGQTGKTVKPTVYIACGISGAVQHKAGMGTASLVIAINKDKDAPIFSFCDLGVVADLNVVVPQLTEAVKRRKGS
jgi:electron transfer flavoprotein alpha subunit